jgi:predicted alpha/beta superfamily hydrolase
MSEYTHVPDDISSRCDGSGLTGGRAGDYADFLVNELKPLIDARYRTLTGRADTAVLGSSLGGLISLYAAYAHPGVYGMAGGMSSTLDWGDLCLGNDTMADIVARAGKRDLRIYIDSGGDGPSNPGGDNWGPTEDLKLLLEAQGFVHGRDLSHWWEPGAPHNEAAWRDRLEKPLRFFFGR